MKTSVRIIFSIVCAVVLPTWGQSNSVVKDGIEWLQPLDFAGYSYDQVAEICPNGVCSGSLPDSGIDLTGYRWASVYDLIPLFNSYGVEPPFSAPFQSRETGDDTVFEDFDLSTRVVEGITRDHSPQNEKGVRRVYTAGFFDCSERSVCTDFSIADLRSGQPPIQIGVWFWRALDDSPEPPPEPPKGDGINLSGYLEIITNRDLDICALVLASGQVTFSCDPPGQYSLINLPTEPDGSVVRQVFARGFFPKSDILWGSGLERVALRRATDCPDYNPPSTTDAFPQSAGKQHSVSGRVLVQRTDTPVCALVLANGAHTFSCDGTGYFTLDFPLDENGLYTLQAYADGFAPSFQTFNEFDYPQEVRMTRSSKCKKIDAPNTRVVDGKKWLQPWEFRGYSYDQVKSVCPDRICTGTLPGNSFNLTGYTWASIADVDSLFSAYQEMDRAILEDFSYTTTDLSTKILYAMLSDPPYQGVRIYIAAVAGVEPYTADGEIVDTLHFPIFPSEKGRYFGAWFWKPAN